MSISSSYNQWSAQYDDNVNPTRDLEGGALRAMTGALEFERVLEVGCGTGKNTGYLLERGAEVTGVDFSEGMLRIAGGKWEGKGARFVQADITQPWRWAEGPFDLITTSLVLEHIEGLETVFNEGAAVLRPGGHWYVGELHPFKQYSGSKARFDTASGTQVVDCYTHHLSDFIRAAQGAGLQLIHADEFFDGHDRSGLPRVLALIFRKP